MGVKNYADNARVFGNKVYSIAGGWSTKRKANESAKRRRKQGYLVRIVNLEAGWYLYEHWNRR
jgi:hypothetical protein